MLLYTLMHAKNDTAAIPHSPNSLRIVSSRRGRLLRKLLIGPSPNFTPRSVPLQPTSGILPRIPAVMVLLNARQPRIRVTQSLVHALQSRSLESSLCGGLHGFLPVASFDTRVRPPPSGVVDKYLAGRNCLLVRCWGDEFPCVVIWGGFYAGIVLVFVGVSVIQGVFGRDSCLPL
jgi:hypothetical protein